jgi:molybdopterin-containing oxidoreductase family membrane subunit
MSATSVPRSGSSTGLVAGLAGLVLTSAFVIWQLMSQGHAAYNASSVGLMWGLPIVTYDFLLMSSAGLALVASMWTVFGLADFAPIARRATWLALALLVGAVAALFLELGHPLRALYAIPANLQIKAPLFWKVIAVAVFAACLILMATGWLSKGDGKPSGGVARLAALAALGVVFTGALMYATLSMRPFWHSGEVPVMVLVEAVLAGLAFALLFTHLAGDSDATRAVSAGGLPGLVALLTLLALLFALGRMIVGLASNLDGMQVWQKIVASPAFWVHIGCLVVAMWLTASASMRASSGMQTLAMLLLIVGLFIGKYEFVIGGQLVPLFKGSWVHGLIQYTPSAAEWVLLAMSAFLAYAVYAFGAARYRLGS